MRHSTANVSRSCSLCSAATTPARLCPPVAPLIGLCAARDYHIAHHDIPDGCFNVYLPLFDVLFGTFKPAVVPAASQSSRHTVSRPLKPRIVTWLFEEIFLYILLAWISLIVRYYSQPSGKA